MVGPRCVKRGHVNQLRSGDEPTERWNRKRFYYEILVLVVPQEGEHGVGNLLSKIERVCY